MKYIFEFFHEFPLPKVYIKISSNPYYSKCVTFSHHNTHFKMQVCHELQATYNNGEDLGYACQHTNSNWL